jgi:hypothetical protein
MGYAADCLGSFELRNLWRFCRACQATWPDAPGYVARSVVWDAAIKGLLRQRARAFLDVAAPRARDWVIKRRLRRVRPPWLALTDSTLIARLEHRPFETHPVQTAPGEGTYVRAIRMLSQSPSVSMELEQARAWAGLAGFRLLFPYFDRDLVELSLRMPPEHLIAGGRAKAPLHRLVADRLPSVAMPTRKVLFRRAFDSLFRRHGRRAWAALGGPRLLAELDLVNPALVGAFMDDYFRGATQQSIEAWLVLSMEAWLQARLGRP